MARIDDLRKIATRLRVHCLRMTTAAGSGHPTSCLSAADIAACLFFSEMRWNTADPHDPGNDEFVLSKGHAAPLLWAAYAEARLIPFESLLDLRKITSDLEGHPTPRMPWVKAATGSLGQGLSIGAGMALAQRLDKSPARTYVLMGDGEIAEGNVWEAVADAAVWKLKNLVAIVDVNRLGQSGPTMHQHDMGALARKFRGFGWEALVIDGHKIDKILAALKQAGKKGLPTAILARTIKGKGVSFVEDKNGWHGRALKTDELARALEEIGSLTDVDSHKLVRPARPYKKKAVAASFEIPKPDYAEKTATRAAYGKALLKLGQVNPLVVAIDGDVKNSTHALEFFEAFPRRSYESFICEQQMTGLAVGLAAKGYIPFVATFAAFLSRAHDQIRMAAYSFANIKLCGSHVGVSIGEDGPSQMGLEDMAIFRPIPGCIVLYPSDAVSAEACVAAAAAHKGMCYIRTTRPATPVLYGADETFPIGGAKVVRKADTDAVTVIAAGITVHEALKAHGLLAKEGIGLRIIDAYSVAPLDAETIRREVDGTGGRVVVAEDHYPAGGLGGAVLQALAGERISIRHLCIRELPRSGKPDELLEMFGISAGHIAGAAKELLGR
jgi:transketolase